MAEVVAVPPMVVPLPVRRWRADDFQDERRNHQSVWIPFRGPGVASLKELTPPRLRPLSQRPLSLFTIRR